jgi:hypothetical protein
LTLRARAYGRNAKPPAEASGIVADIVRGFFVTGLGGRLVITKFYRLVLHFLPFQTDEASDVANFDPGHWRDCRLNLYSLVVLVIGAIIYTYSVTCLRLPGF